MTRCPRVSFRSDHLRVLAEAPLAILLGALGKSSMAKGSAELSEFAATKFEPMMTLAQQN